ncbi:MAG: hypothetical protein LBU25_05640 [Treponema sp.]|jgi:hypothetical protein|nr:hypothetical protein [Treponema sp.]
MKIKDVIGKIPQEKINRGLSVIAYIGIAGCIVAFIPAVRFITISS